MLELVLHLFIICATFRLIANRNHPLLPLLSSPEHRPDGIFPNLSTDFYRKDRNKNIAVNKTVSKQLLGCRATKDFIKFAKQRGAIVTINSNHAKVTHNNTFYILSSPGKKHDLQNSACKLTINAFKGMGIAFDEDV